MGWKAFRDRFEIKHLVQITEKGICIGSGYVHDLAVVDLQTGHVRENKTFGRFVEKNYPALHLAGADEIRALIQAADVFNASIPVFTYNTAREIVEFQCEAPGWPNVTHDGQMMYTNRFSTDKAQVVAWAKQDAALGARYDRENVERLETELVNARERLAKSLDAVVALNEQYPEKTA